MCVDSLELCLTLRRKIGADNKILNLLTNMEIVMSKLKERVKKIIAKHTHTQLDTDKIQRYREFDEYELDIEVYGRKSIYIASKLPSEPPEGITYEFGPSGYMGEISSNYCAIPTTFRNFNNYCHWSFSEIPFLFLAFESGVENIVLPDALIDANLPFQKRWLELLCSMYPSKNILRISKTRFPEDALIPVNHDTSKSTRPVGNTQYMWYHRSRATPYLIDRIENRYQTQFHSRLKGLDIPHFYINRTTRRLKNEREVQKLVKELGFEIVNLDELTLDEQVYLFSQAKTIVGFHGAGLANLLYANQSAQVFEIVDKDCVYPCYVDGLVIRGKKATRTYFHMLSEMKGLDYAALESNDYVLDLNYLREKLSAAVSMKHEAVCCVTH